MTNDVAEWRARVGVAIEHRRRAVKLRSMRAAADQAGVSETTWRQIESGRRQLHRGFIVAPTPSDNTKTAVCMTLGWAPDCIDRLLRGEEPRALEPDFRSHHAETTTGSAHPDGGETPPADLAALVRLIDEIHARLAELEVLVQEVSASASARR